MCLGGRRREPEPKPDPEIEIEQESQEEIAKQETKKAKQDALQKIISKRRGGTGRRSLITGTGGGIGYFNKYFGGIE